MLIVIIEKVEGKKILKVLGLVRGSIIRVKYVGKDIGVSFKNFVGGEFIGYNEMFIEVR